MTFDFGEAPRNCICWSPHARFLAIAGFGNLSGERYLARLYLLWLYLLWLYLLWLYLLWLLWL